MKPSLRYDNFLEEFRQAFPEFEDELHRLFDDDPSDEPGPGPYVVMAMTFVPSLADPEINTHLMDPVSPHSCRADDVVRWTERMSAEGDVDVKNSVLIDIFEGKPTRVLDVLPWGPITRGRALQSLEIMVDDR